MRSDLLAWQSRSSGSSPSYSDVVSGASSSQRTNSSVRSLQSQSTSADEWMRRASRLSISGMSLSSSDGELSGHSPRVLPPHLQSWVSAHPFECIDRMQVAQLLLRDPHNLSLCDSNITELPPGMAVKFLSLSRCQKVRCLPTDCQIECELKVSCCDKFEFLPELHLTGDLNLVKLPQLSSLGNINLGGSLNISNCGGLRVAPAEVTIGGHVVIEHCDEMSTVSESLAVQGNVSICGCPNLSGLPNHMSLGGDLTLQDVPMLTNLPSWIGDLPALPWPGFRQISFRNTGISVSEQQALQYDLPHANVRCDATERHRSLTLEALISQWLQRSGEVLDGEASSLASRLPASQDLVLFLSRLTETPEYKFQGDLLSRRVCQVLYHLADGKIPQQEGLEQIHYMIDSCVDGVIQILEDLELAARVSHARRSPNPALLLRHLGEDLYKLQVIRNCAFGIAEKQDTESHFPASDPVEIFLALEVELAPKLALPVTTQHMQFRGCAGLTDETIAMVEQTVLAAAQDQAKVQAYLDDFEPLQRCLREADVAAFDRRGRDTISMGSFIGQECPITKEPVEALEDPVTIKGQAGVFECSELLKAWLESPKNPCTRERFVLDSIVLVRRGPYSASISSLHV